MIRPKTSRMRLRVEHWDYREDLSVSKKAFKPPQMYLLSLHANSWPALGRPRALKFALKLILLHKPGPRSSSAHSADVGKVT